MLAVARFGESGAGGDELVGEGGELGARLRADDVDAFAGADPPRRSRERPGIAHHHRADTADQSQ